MAEYIEKQAAKEKLCGMCRWEGTSNCDECEHPIDDILPADVRPVVRCRDCFANGLCSVQDALFDNDLDKAADFYCANGRVGEDGKMG